MLPELDLNPRLRPSLQASKNLVKPLALIASYGAWTLLCRLLFLSFLTYFLTRQGHRASFEEINEAFATNELPFIGLASASFVLLLKALSPLFDRAGELKIEAGQLASSYVPGFLRGLTLGISIVAALVLVGSLHFIGFFVQIEDAPVAILSIVIRTAALLAIGFCDELVFRAWRSPSLSAPGAALGAGLIALAFGVVKMAQFELSWMHFATLVLLSLALSARRQSQESFLNGAGFWAALLIAFHPLFSLPIFGNDFSGIFLLKYQPQAGIPPWISGGVGGPLSSGAFQVILLIEIVRGWAVRKKGLLKLSTSQ